MSEWNTIAIWVFSYLAWDLCFYWMHRLHHQYSILWAVHSIHHEGEHFNLSLGIRNSWYSSLSNFPFVVILAIIGMPLEVFITVSSINYFIQFYNHNGFIKRSGFLEKFMVTPSHHKVHHGSNDIYRNKNFGGTFIFWDQIFGTYQPELDAIPVNLGIAHHQRTEEIVGMNNLPFLKLFGYKQKTSAETTKKYSNLSIGISGLLSFVLLLAYIGYENVWTTDLKSQYFVLVFLFTLSSGLMSENKSFGYILWLLNCLLLTVFVIVNALPSAFFGAIAVLFASGILFRSSFQKSSNFSQTPLA